MSDVKPLTQRQIRCIENLPENHELVSLDEGPPIVQGPNGALMQVKTNGRIVALVQTAQSYLQVHG